MTDPGEVQAIVEGVSRFPQGASIAELEEELRDLALHRRTLQRRLAALEGEGRIRAQGPPTKRRYFPVSSSVPEPPPLSVAEDREEYFDISSEARKVKESVRRPIHQRTPVAYNRKFLESYRPNATYYLPESVRADLRSAGTLPEGLPPGTHSRDAHNRLLIDLSWNSSRLEGNTYSLLDTERLIQLGREAEGKDATETLMILNHKAAIELLVEAPAELHVSRYLLLNLHALLSNNLLPNAYDTGRLRTAPVSVGGTVYMPPAIPQMIEECFDIIVSKAVLIEDPFEQSFFMMVHIPYLQPFIDVNKRVSRLAANIPLIKAGLCPLSFTDVPQQAYVDGTLAVYETNAVALLREVFIWAYRRSCDRFAVVRQTLGPPNMFRLKYRLELQEAVHNVVRDAMTADAAKAYLEKYALQIPDDDRREFIAMAMVELRCLHEGNFMRFRVRLSEFERWQGAQ